MKIPTVLSAAVLAAWLTACNGPQPANITTRQANATMQYACEPADSADYRPIKYELFWHKSGQLCERKRVLERDTTRHCEFIVFYDSLLNFYTDDTVLSKPLKSVIDTSSYVELGNTSFSKDKHNVYFFYGNSDGGTRQLVAKADPATTRPLYEYRWAADDKRVFYETQEVQGANPQKIEPVHSPDTTDHFVDYVKDNQHVFYQSNLVKGADAPTFKIAVNTSWDAEDKYFKYQNGIRYTGK